MSKSVSHQLAAGLKTLRLPTMASLADNACQTAVRENMDHQTFLLDLVEQELATRQENRISRILRESGLPPEKTLEAFDTSRLSKSLSHTVNGLVQGDFLDRFENVLAFGNPGSGKTHLLCGIAHCLARNGHSILFAPAVSLIQQLLAAKRDLELPRLLRRLDRFRLIFLDDIGYVQHSQQEMEVLFNFLAHRYERGSVMITSNLPFSKWDMLFKDPMTTAAAIDRLVHHCIILEMNMTSWRLEHAKADQKAAEKEVNKPSSDG